MVARAISFIYNVRHLNESPLRVKAAIQPARCLHDVGRAPNAAAA
jgi:hypothetical protein